MNKILSRISFPLLLVSIIALQSYGVESIRSRYFHQEPDSLSVTGHTDTLDSISTAVIDSLRDTTHLLFEDSLEFNPTDTLGLSLIDTLILSARDTIHAPDSLRHTDPFFYKYYVAVKDSTTRRFVRDSLMAAGDTTELFRLDSLYIKDSTEVATLKFNQWYGSLSRKERKKYDAEQRLPELIAEANRKMAIKDSIRAHKDSVIEATPRILETFAFPDSLKYKRIVTWTHDRDFHDLNGLRDQSPDSSFNNNYYDFLFKKKDLNATWLGMAGSPVQLYDYFKREDEENVIFYTPYRIHSFDPANLPQYNTKTPYTELDYYGTLFSNKETEESNIKILVSQNITPKLNLTMQYHRNGGNGMLRNERTDNRTAFVSSNYVGEKYLMHTGFIYNRIERNENGGIAELEWIRDTIVDAREIEVNLTNAKTKIKRNTVFLDQSYRIPLSFLDKDERERKKEIKRLEILKDSIMVHGDSLAIADFTANQGSRLQELMTEVPADSLKTDITTAFIGHSSEYSVYRKSYTDNISSSDLNGRNFYNDRFYINPVMSNDSLRVMRLENKVFIRLQPWKSDGIVSKLDVGVGDKLLNYYSFSPNDYVKGMTNVVQNSAYLYAGANGQFKKYFIWDAKGRYTFLGHELNDFNVGGNLSFSVYPFRRDRNSPLTLNLHFETDLAEPDYYQQHVFTNHYKWDNDFNKISTTKLEASLLIPRWNMDASFAYGLLDNNIYYDTLGIARQNTRPMSVITASLRKDFKLWKFHLENRAMLQFSSNQEVMPLPLLSLNLRYYFQFDVVKNVMKMQIGANGLFTTKWHAPAYNPVLGVFFNQDKEMFGNCPYIDVFINVQWKRACVFVKMLNANMGWPNKSRDYFTASGYIAPQRCVKIGITWPFYVLSEKNGSGNKNLGGAKSGGNRNPGGGRTPQRPR